MNAIEEDVFMQIQGTNQPVMSTDIDRHSSDVKPVLSPTHNGYKSISNHISHKSKQDVPNHIKPMKDTKLLESPPKHHSSNVHNNSTSKHGDHSKHKVHSSSSKHKDSSVIKDPSLKSHSSKSSEMKSKDHHSHDKKHDVLKTKDNIPKSPNDISKKHSSKPKEYKDINKVKKEGEKHGSVDHISKESIKDKAKDGSIKEKHKIVISKDKLKESNDRPKEKIKEKSKDSSGTERKTSGEHKIKQEVPKDSSGIERKSLSAHKIKLEVVKKADGTGDYKGPLLVKLKSEVKSPEKQTKIKDEPLSDEEISLAERERQSAKQQLKHKKEADDSDDEPLAKRMKKVKKIKARTTESNKRKNHDNNDFKPSKKIKLEKNHKSRSDTTTSPRKKKNAEEEVEVWKWWEEEKMDDGVKWKTLSHNGPVFAPPYEPLPKSVKFFYNGKHMELSSETEEVAGFYARMLDHDYITKDVFNKNFFTDWQKVMTPEEKRIITDLSKCNFSQINDYYKMKSEERKNRTKEEKLELKRQNEELQQKYGFCIIDGHKQKIGNFKIEPPGLFRGRGEHPKMGMLKRRIYPEDIIINTGKEAPVPEPPEGHKWKKVKHENTVTWLACWSENILGQTKYIMLNPSSKLKGEKDWQKYETARKLKSRAKGIREQYMKDWKSKEMKVRQRAVALYFIDKLALRAGNEKEEGETADTVGCCSLRVEHITLHEEKDGKQHVVDFDFLGKDSIRYVNSVAVEKRVIKNLKLFMENKQPGDDLFDRLNTAILNKHLNELMEGLTAKVFRTYNASKTLQEQLDLLTKEEMSIPEKMLAYNRANRAVAILCNHQRSVPKTFSKQMETLQKKIDEKEAQIKDFKKELKKAKQAYKDSNSSKDKVLYEKKKKRMDQLLEQLKKLEVQATDKEENKQIALGTSKLNYLDPRISAAWCKKWNVPIEKIYNRTQRDKFRWAIEMAGPDFTF